jgi:hypothetical protein
LGPFVFWPFKKIARSKLSDPNVISHLTRIFESYAVVRGNPGASPHLVPMTEITVVSEGEASLREVPDFPSVAGARDALAFACIDGSSDSNWCTSETFDIRQLDFFPDDIQIQYTTGSIIPTKHLGMMVGEVVFPAPIEANIGYRVKPSSDLLSGLSFVLSSPPHMNNLRVLRSLEFFRLAYTNQTNLTGGMRIVLMATAFEALFGMGGRREFRRKIGELCSEVDEPRRRYRIEYHRPGSEDEEEELTEKQIWAEEFYKLRNAIVHADDVTASKIFSTGIPHYCNATVFFRHCVRRVLERLGGLSCRAPSTIVEKGNGKFELDII